MRSNHIILLGVLILVGCDSQIVPNALQTDGGIPYYPDLKCPSVDMNSIPATPKCAAAKGLAGDNLLCFDFFSVADQTLTTPLPQGLSTWTFSKDMSNNDCWQILGGKLQVKNFNNQFADTCRVTLPQFKFNDVDKQKYQTITLAIVQQVDLDLGTTFPNQFAQIYNGTPNLPFLLTQTSGTQPEQQLVLNIDKKNLPSAMANVAKFILQLTSSQKQSKQGLLVSSIAVNASL